MVLAFKTQTQPFLQCYQEDAQQLPPKLMAFTVSSTIGLVQTGGGIGSSPRSPTLDESPIDSSNSSRPMAITSSASTDSESSYIYSSPSDFQGDSGESYSDNSEFSFFMAKNDQQDQNIKFISQKLGFRTSLLFDDNVIGFNDEQAIYVEPSVPSLPTKEVNPTSTISNKRILTISEAEEFYVDEEFEDDDGLFSFEEEECQDVVPKIKTEDKSPPARPSFKPQPSPPLSPPQFSIYPSFSCDSLSSLSGSNSEFEEAEEETEKKEISKGKEKRPSLTSSNTDDTCSTSTNTDDYPPAKTTTTTTTNEITSPLLQSFIFDKPLTPSPHLKWISGRGGGGYFPKGGISEFHQNEELCEALFFVVGGFSPKRREEICDKKRVWGSWW